MYDILEGEVRFASGGQFVAVKSFCDTIHRLLVKKKPGRPHTHTYMRIHTYVYLHTCVYIHT